jgi:glycosyl transferase family 87
VLVTNRNLPATAGQSYLKSKKLFLLFLILLAGVDFLVRGPLRGIKNTEWNDFVSLYIQSRLWVSGQDPYSMPDFVVEWPAGLARPRFVSQEAADGTLIAKRGVPSPYPLTSFVVLAPLSLLPWPVARAVWILLNVLAFGLTLGMLASLAAAKWTESRTQIFFALGLALAPFHTGFATLNPTVLIVGLSVAAVWEATRGRQMAAGILLGIAVCVKPQLGLCFVLYYLVRRRWNVVAIAGGWIAAVALIAIVRLAASGVPWLSTYLENSMKVFAPGAVNDFTTSNPVWYNMINLQVLFWQVARNASLANWLAVLVGLFLLGIWFLLTTRHSSCQLLQVSALVVLSLLPVYHRFYDAALLIWPLSWSLLIAKVQDKRVARLILACVIPFLLPGAALLNQLAEKGRVPSNIVNNWCWNGLIVSHQVWIVLILCVVLLAALGKFPRRFSDAR